jgi:hypothetical protein
MKLKSHHLLKICMTLIIKYLHIANLAKINLIIEMIKVIYKEDLAETWKVNKMSILKMWLTIIWIQKKFSHQPMRFIQMRENLMTVKFIQEGIANLVNSWQLKIVKLFITIKMIIQ